MQKICRAMKTVSSIKARKAEERVRVAVPYLNALTEMVTRLCTPDVVHPLMEERPVVASCVISISGDKGLAGSYNANIIRETIRLLSSMDNVHAIPIGRKIADTARRLKIKVDAMVSPLGSNPEYFGFASLADRIADLFTRREWDRVYMVHTLLNGKVAVDRFLPIAKPQLDKPAAEIVFEPDRDTIVQQLLPQYLRSKLYTAVITALAAEHSIRMTAMSLATENADEIVDQLTLQFNKSRQAGITRDLSDIVGTAEALR